MENHENPIITPRTKVLQLIETWPQLEDILIGYVPAFSKLKNPVLRKTVARIATLQQAAAVGNVKVEDLINHLRKETGQDTSAEGQDTTYNYNRPPWFDDSRQQTSFDVREMLAAGEHPVNQVMADLRQLPAGHLYKLIAPFLPAPLIDKASSMSVKHWINRLSEDEFIVWFYKKEE